MPPIFSMQILERNLVGRTGFGDLVTASCDALEQNFPLVLLQQAAHEKSIAIARRHATVFRGSQVAKCVFDNFERHAPVKYFHFNYPSPERNPFHN